MVMLNNLNWAKVSTYSKLVIAGWSLLVLVLDAAFIAKFNQYFNRYGYFGGSGFSGANAVIACCIFNMAYFVGMFFFQRMRPNNIGHCMIVDTTVIGFLFLFNLGSFGSLTTVAAIVGTYNNPDWWGLGQAVVGLGWLMVFIILALLVMQVWIVLKNHGGSLPVWKTSFVHLCEGHVPASTEMAYAAPAKEDIEAKNYTTQPVMNQQPYTPHPQQPQAVTVAA